MIKLDEILESVDCDVSKPLSQYFAICLLMEYMRKPERGGLYYSFHKTTEFDAKKSSYISVAPWLSVCVDVIWVNVKFAIQINGIWDFLKKWKVY